MHRFLACMARMLAGLGVNHSLYDYQRANTLREALQIN